MAVVLPKIHGERKVEKTLQGDERYELREKIGTGSFGVVYLALDRQRNTRVAIKETTVGEAFDNEVSIMKVLNHPCIVKFHNAYTVENKSRFVLEFIDGQTLHAILVAKVLPFDTTFRLFYQAALALAAVHGAGVAHRDIKLENFMVTKDYELKVIDFGLSTYIEEPQDFVGSARYCAPEVILHLVYNSQVADMWSFGCVVFALFCGRLPFCTTNNEKLFRDISSGSYSIPEGCDDQLKELLKGLLSVDPSTRWTIHQVLQSKFWVARCAEYRLPPREITDDIPRSGLPSHPRYIFHAQVGSGSFSRVYRATDRNTDTIVAIKQIIDDETYRDELKAMKAVSGKSNIIKYIDSYEKDSGYFIVMNMIDGKCLLHLCRQGISPQLGFTIFHQVVVAMQGVHDMGIAHRDIKLDNFMISRDNVVTLIDFGMATNDKESELRCGSLHYVAPEVVNQPKYNCRVSDMWSVGCIAYALFCGRLPFLSGDKDVLLRDIFSANFPTPSGIDSSLLELIQHLLCVDPKKRWTVNDIVSSKFWYRQCIDHGMKLDIREKSPRKPSSKPKKLSEAFRSVFSMKSKVSTI